MSLAALRIAAALALAALLVPPALAANPCTRGDESGIGGTGHTRGAQGGIGGSGRAPDDPDEGGIGGTGISGETGIIGTITGFGSICVGEIEIRYEADTPVRVDERIADAAELRVGHVVEVISAGAGDQFQARAITLRHIVVGPVDHVDAAQNRIRVLGQLIQLDSATRSRGASGDVPVQAGDLERGKMVAVSGLRAGGGAVHATRVDPSEESLARLSGPLTTADRLAIGGTPVEMPGTPPSSFESGREAMVRGRWTGERIEAYRIEIAPPVPFEGTVQQVEIEGFAEAAPGSLRVGSWAVAGGAPTVRSGELVRVSARLTADGKLLIRSLRPVLPPPPLAPRHHPGSAGPGETGPAHATRPGAPPPRRGEQPDESAAPMEHHAPPPQEARPPAPHDMPPAHVPRPDRPPAPPPQRPELPAHPPQMPPRPPGPPPPRPEVPHLHRHH